MPSPRSKRTKRLNTTSPPSSLPTAARTWSTVLSPSSTLGLIEQADFLGPLGQLALDDLRVRSRRRSLGILRQLRLEDLASAWPWRPPGSRSPTRYSGAIAAICMAESSASLSNAGALAAASVAGAHGQQDADLAAHVHVRLHLAGAVDAQAVPAAHGDVLTELADESGARLFDAWRCRRGTSRRPDRCPASPSSAAFATLSANAKKSALRAAKSVWMFTSTMTPRLPSAVTADTTTPSVATAPARLALLARPFLRMISTAFSMSPPASVRARRQSLRPALRAIAELLHLLHAGLAHAATSIFAVAAVGVDDLRFGLALLAALPGIAALVLVLVLATTSGAVDAGVGDARR